MNKQEFSTRNILRFEDTKPESHFLKEDFLKKIEEGLPDRNVTSSVVRRGIESPSNMFSQSSNLTSNGNYSNHETDNRTHVSTTPATVINASKAKNYFYTCAAILIIAVVIYYFIRKKKKEKENQKKDSENNWGEYKFLNNNLEEFKETDIYKIGKELVHFIFIIAMVTIFFYVLAFLVKGVRKAGDEMFS